MMQMNFLDCSHLARTQILLASLETPSVFLRREIEFEIMFTSKAVALRAP